MNYIDLPKEVVREKVLSEMMSKNIRQRWLDYLFQNHLASPLLVMEHTSYWENERAIVLLNQIKLAEVEGVDLTERVYIQHMLMNYHNKKEFETLVYGLVDLSLKKYLKILLTHTEYVNKDIMNKLLSVFTKDELIHMGIREDDFSHIEF